MFRKLQLSRLLVVFECLGYLLIVLPAGFIPIPLLVRLKGDLKLCLNSIYKQVVELKEICPSVL